MTSRAADGQTSGTGLGALVLVATPIGNVKDISARAIETLSKADLVCCEDTRHTGMLLKRLELSARKLMSLNAHNEAQRAPEVVSRVANGELVALVSDAGTPAISDPGQRLVARMVEAGLRVTMVPGPTAAIMALCLSGFSVERFAFEGFLPRRGQLRHDRLRQIADSEVTVVIYESPHRVADTLADLRDVCGGDRRVVVARELTKLHEQVWSGSLEQSEAHVAQESRGEHVVVVGPSSVSRADRFSDHSEEIRRLADAGLSRRDVASALEILVGISHNDAYQAVLHAKLAEK